MPSGRSSDRVLRAIARCRTAALGGHVEACDACGARRVAYNSCRNRHCPKCQGSARAKWLAAQQRAAAARRVLPCRLHPAARPQRPRCVSIRAGSTRCFPRRRRHAAVLRPGSPPSRRRARRHRGAAHLGTEPLPAPPRALRRDGRRARPPMVSTWVSARRGFLFPVRALSQVFRGKFLAGLRQLRARGRLRFAGEQRRPRRRAAGGQPGCRTLRATEWVVYAKPPFGGPDARAEVPGPLHAPGRHRQPPPASRSTTGSCASAGRTTPTAIR